MKTSAAAKRVALATLATLALAGCGDGDSVPVDQQAQTQQVASGGGPITFSAPLPTTTGDDDDNAAAATTGEDQNAISYEPPPPPNVTPDEVILPRNN
jgi:hypothetical protein